METKPFTPEELKELWLRCHTLFNATKCDTIENTLLRDAYFKICNGIDILQDRIGKP